MAYIPTGPLNTTAYERSAPSRDPLPNGIYHGIVVKTEQKSTNGEKGVGIMLEVEFDITAPEEYSNRKFWDRFNIVNPSEKATRIAIEALADLGLAAGFTTLEDDEQLIGREVMLELYVDPAKPYKDKRTGEVREGKAQNACSKYWPIGTDIEGVKKAKKSAAAPAHNPAAVISAAPAQPRKWDNAAPAAAPANAGGPPPFVRSQMQPQPAAQQPAPQVAPQAATGGAPWKRNSV